MSSIDHYVFYHDKKKLDQALMGRRFDNVQFIDLNHLIIPEQFRIKGLGEKENKAVFSEYLGILLVKPTSVIVSCATYSIPIKFSAGWCQESNVEQFLPAIRFSDLYSMSFDINKLYAVEIKDPLHIVKEEMLDIHCKFKQGENIPLGPFKGTFVVRLGVFEALQKWLWNVTLYLLEKYKLEDMKIVESSFDKSNIAQRSKDQQRIDSIRHKYGTILERSVAYFLGAQYQPEDMVLIGREIFQSKLGSSLLREVKRLSENNTIVVAFGDSKYSEVAEKWIEMVRACSVNNYLFIALDQDLYESFLEKGFHVEFRDFRGSLKEFWPFRLAVLQEILEAGYHVLHSDADAFWIKNPLQVIYIDESDVIISQGTVFPENVLDEWGFVLCCGFMFFRSKLNVLVLFEKVLKEARSIGDDQMALNRVLFNENIKWKNLNTYYNLSLRGKVFKCYRKTLKGETAAGLTISLLPHQQYQRLFEGITEDVKVLHILSEKKEGSKMEVLERIQQQMSIAQKRSDIIWLVSFPRSGNTLMRTIFKQNFGLNNYSLYNDRNDIGKYKEIREFVGHKDGDWGYVCSEEFYQYPEKLDVDPRDGLTIIKTHSQFGEYYRGKKVIYVVRDPRSAIRSLVAYRKDFAGDDRTDKEILSDLIHRGDPLSGRWSDHVKSWLNNASLHDLLVIKFEDILSKFDETLKRIADFIGVEPFKRTLTDFEEYKKANSRFFRKGKVKGWHELIGPAEEQLIWLSSSANMKKFGYEKVSTQNRAPLAYPLSCFSDNSAWVYVVTPTFNSEKMLDATINSVVTQEGDFVLRYHVQDGGSTDQTLEILKKWKERIESGAVDMRCRNIEFTFDSGPDAGMYYAVNKAFELLSPPSYAICSYINSDDVFFPGAIATASMLLSKFNEYAWIVPSGYTIGTNANHRGRGQRFLPSAYISAGLCDGVHMHFIQQEGIFWRHSVWSDVGGFDMSFRLAGDWDLWRKYATISDPLYAYYMFGAFRKHAGQLSEKISDYHDEIDATFSVAERKSILESLEKKRIMTPGDFKVSIVTFDAVEGYVIKRQQPTIGQGMLRGEEKPNKVTFKNADLARANAHQPPDDELFSKLETNMTKFSQMNLDSYLIENIRLLIKESSIDKNRLRKIITVLEN